MKTNDEDLVISKKDENCEIVQFPIFSWMYFDLFLSVGSSPQTLINQYHNLNLGALSRRIKLQIANFQGEKNIFLLHLIILLLATHTKAAVFLSKNKTDVI